MASSPPPHFRRSAAPCPSVSHSCVFLVFWRQQVVKTVGAGTKTSKHGPPVALLTHRNAQKHKKHTFSCFFVIGAEIARTGGHMSKTPSSDLVRPTWCHHYTFEKQPFSRVFRFSRKVNNCQPYSCHCHTRHENALAASLPPQFRIPACFLFFGDKKSSKLYGQGRKRRNTDLPVLLLTPTNATKHKKNTFFV